MLIVGAIASVALISYRLVLNARLHDKDYDIDIIVQTGPKVEALSTAYLAELMDLCIDVKTNSYAFDSKKAERKLLASPLIKRAKVTKVYPNTVFVDYTVREPKAMLYDYLNCAIDEEGYLFPLSPFFTPKKLPEIYLGLLPFGQEDEFGKKGGSFNKPLDLGEIKLAFSIIDHFEKSPLRLLRVDVSNAFSDSWGRREIVLVIEDVDGSYRFSRILRLITQNYEDDLQRYTLIRTKLIEDALAKMDLNERKTIIKGPGLIIDLRIQDLAYVR